MIKSLNSFQTTFADYPTCLKLHKNNHLKRTHQTSNLPTFSVTKVHVFGLTRTSDVVKHKTYVSCLPCHATSIFSSTWWTTRNFISEKTLIIHRDDFKSGRKFQQVSLSLGKIWAGCELAWRISGAVKMTFPMPKKFHGQSRFSVSDEIEFVGLARGVNFNEIVNWSGLVEQKYFGGENLSFVGKKPKFDFKGDVLCTKVISTFCRHQFHVIQCYL